MKRIPHSPSIVIVTESCIGWNVCVCVFLEVGIHPAHMCECVHEKIEGKNETTLTNKNKVKGAQRLRNERPNKAPVNEKGEK